MEENKKQKIKIIALTIVCAIFTLTATILLSLFFSNKSKGHQNEENALVLKAMNVPNYSYSVDNEVYGSFNVYLMNQAGKKMKPDSIDDFICEKHFVAEDGTSKPVISRARKESIEPIYYNVDKEYKIEDTKNKYDIVMVTVVATYKGVQYSHDINFKVTATPNYNLKFYYNTMVGETSDGPMSELNIGSGNRLDLVIEDANFKGANIDIDTSVRAKDILNNYTFDGWYILDKEFNLTSRRLDINDYFDISDMYVQNEITGIKYVSVVARYKTKLILDDDMGDIKFLSVKNGMGEFVADEREATDIYYNEEFPLLKNNLPRYSKKNGWDFVEWSSEQAGQGQDYLDTNRKFIMKSPHLYAKWKSDIKIDSVFKLLTLDAENIEIDKEDSSDTTLVVKDVIYHGPLALPSASQLSFSHGGMFIGWYTNIADTEEEVNNTKFSLSTDVRIYAKVKFDIDLQTQGVTLENNKVAIEYGKNGDSIGQITSLLPYPKNEIEDSWKFEGWNTAKDGTGEMIETLWNKNPYSFDNPHSNDLILYATRSTNFYLYRQIDEQGQKIAYATAKKVFYNRSLTDIIPQNINDVNGWHYEGYYEVLNNNNGVITLSDKKISPSEIYTGYGNRIFGAKWSAEIFLDTLYEGVISKTVTYNHLPKLPSNVIYEYDNGNKKGTFLGWYTSVNGVEEEVKDTEAFQFMPNQDFYAKVKFPLDLQGRLLKPESTYNLIFGSNSNNRKEIGTLERNLPTTFSEQYGWSFVGWNTLNNGSGKLIDSTWEINPYENQLQLFDDWKIELKVNRLLDENGQKCTDSSILTINYNSYPKIPQNLISEGWTYTGIYKNLDNLSTQISGDSPYVSRDNVKEAFVRWTTDNVVLNKTNIKTGELQEFKLKEVVYNAIPDISKVDDYYYAGGKCTGWYSEDKKQEISGNQKYVGGPNTVFYDNIAIPIKTDGMINTSYKGKITNSIEEYIIYYGETLNDFFARKTLKEPTIEDDLWKFEYWYFIVSGEEQNVLNDNIKNLVFDFNIINDIEKSSNDGNEYLLLKAKWSCEVTVVNNYIEADDILSTNKIVAYNNQEISVVTKGIWGNWSFVDLYNSINEKGDFINSVDNNYLGTGKTTIYAKWVCSTTLIYNNEESNEQISFIYGVKNDRLLQLSTQEISREGYEGFLAWSADVNETYSSYENSSSIIDQNTIIYPKNMKYIYGVWLPKRYTITLHNFPKEDIVVHVMSGDLIDDIVPPQSSSLKTFSGYYYNDIKYINSNGIGIRQADFYKFTSAMEIELEAKWNKSEARISLVNKLEGTSADSYIEGVVVDGLLPTNLRIPKLDGYVFDGYYTTRDNNGILYYNQTGGLENHSTWDGEVTILYAHWKANRHTIIKSGSNATITIKVGSNILSDQDLTSVAYNTQLTVSISYHKSNGQSCYYKYLGTIYELNNLNYSFSMPDTDVEVYAYSEDPPKPADSSCVAAGTMILMSDGTTRPIENIKIGDKVLAFDHSIGEFVETSVFYTYKEYGYVESTYLRFTDNIEIELLNSGQGLFDINLLKYVLVNSESVSNYLGHDFLIEKYVDGKYVVGNVTLLEYTISKKETYFYDIATEMTMTSIANSLINCSDTLVGVCNTFSYGSDFRYDETLMEQDIEIYGLYDYEEWCEYITYEDFIAFNGAYFKITVGKGLITEEAIISLIEDLLISKNNEKLLED